MEPHVYAPSSLWTRRSTYGWTAHVSGMPRAPALYAVLVECSGLGWGHQLPLDVAAIWADQGRNLLVFINNDAARASLAKSFTRKEEGAAITFSAVQEEDRLRVCRPPVTLRTVQVGVTSARFYVWKVGACRCRTGPLSTRWASPVSLEVGSVGVQGFISGHVVSRRRSSGPGAPSCTGSLNLTPPLFPPKGKESSQRA